MIHSASSVLWSQAVIYCPFDYTLVSYWFRDLGRATNSQTKSSTFAIQVAHTELGFQFVPSPCCVP